MQGDPIDYEDGMNRDVMFKSRKRELTFWIVMFLVLMSFFLFQYKNIIGGMMDNTDFNKVEGRIISSTSSFSSGGRTSSGYYVEIIYSYTINGNKFESDKYSFGPSFYSDLGDVEAITKQYKPGDAVTVFASKTSPNISVLALQKNSNVKLIFVFCMLLLLFTAVYVDVRKRRILQDEKQGQKKRKKRKK